MRFIAMLSLVGCVQDDDTREGFYPEPTGDADYDLGDYGGLMAEAYGVLCSMGDPWNCEMAAANIDSVQVGCMDDYDDLWSSYRDGELWLCLYDPNLRPGGLPPILNVYVSTLAHESGHGRPLAKSHVPCHDGDYAGEEVCDRDVLGSVYSELHALEQIDDPWMVTHREEVRGRLELP